MVGQRDVFIAHAHPDKPEFVRPLVAALARRGVACWVDEAVIRPGESLIGAMQEGLRNSRFVVVVLTERFLAARWAPRELNAALHLEARAGSTRVIPVVALPPAKLDDYPLLLDKRWLEWSLGVDAIAAEIGKLFDRRPSAEWHVDPPASFVGPIWMRAVADASRRGKRHVFTLRWGPHVRRVEVESVGADPISFAFHKTRPDRVFLHVQVDPPAVLAFGFGAAPDADPLVIDEGWERSAGWSFPDVTDPRARVRDETDVGGSGAASDIPSDAFLFHVRVSRFLRFAEALNLTRDELDERYLRPWLRERGVVLNGRFWSAERCRLTVYHGPRVTRGQRTLGQGWIHAVRFGEDVTNDVLRGERGT